MKLFVEVAHDWRLAAIRHEPRRECRTVTDNFPSAEVGRAAARLHTPPNDTVA